MVLSGTLAVTRVPWSPSPDAGQVLTASADNTRTDRAHPRAPEDVLLDRLMAKLHRQNPGAALDGLHHAVRTTPSLAKHCEAISGKLGRAAVRTYGTAKARSYAKPVCDSSYLAGINR
jgi:hypothetical protein